MPESWIIIDEPHPHKNTPKCEKRNELSAPRRRSMNDDKSVEAFMDYMA